MTRTRTTLTAAIVLVAATLPLHAAARARYLMGTVCRIEAAEGRAIDLAFAEAERIERMLSTWREDSELSRLNRGETAAVSPELTALLRTAIDRASLTGGAFNPLVGPLVDVWKTRDAGALPDRERVTRAVARAALANVALADRIVLRNAAEFEEGGFGKGYAIDRMLAVTGCDATIDFGGQIAVCGSREVAVADPRDRDRPVVAFTLTNASLSTSSGSEKTFQVCEPGLPEICRTFSHIFDPRTGEALPPRGSVSVVVPSALDADILSTALYVLGPREGLRWADANGVAALFINEHSIQPSKRFREIVPDLRVVDGNYRIEESAP